MDDNEWRRRRNRRPDDDGGRHARQPWLVARLLVFLVGFFLLAAFVELSSRACA